MISRGRSKKDEEKKSKMSRSDRSRKREKGKRKNIVERKTKQKNTEEKNSEEGGILLMVVAYLSKPLMQRARSFVICPASTVSMQTSSMAFANLSSCWLLSSLAL